MITRRGWAVIWLVILLVVGLFTYATRDICYTGHGPIGYSSCEDLFTP
ncbi:hypothetical protein UFOVP1616_3 [uncultured Caudovirales phage]|uniref:Uncharacterized protein n=1 Tax=uncultured Caudovirales phage TaxID=2100421 RepID=A0A6J5SL01_9CAUD|nr:hypothetical protein UFOVP1467_19 [uncultured Caudovirales phage]CAB4219619.1 hypothetical protein UFOVP1616_3 [uncultured Caudovirales phage]